MLKRKIEQKLLDWKNNPNRKPLLIKGCRQCGKTCSVRDFAERHYEHVVYLNFFENPFYTEIFSESLEVDYLVMMMSTRLRTPAVFEAGKTIIILDEIQECPEARTALKFFRQDGRFDVIATGSLLGVKGYGKEPRSIPVGSETVVDMYPLDFEEFLWAHGINETVISFLSECLEQEKAVPAAMHSRMGELLRQYMVVGGMPDAVQTFVDTRNMQEVLQIQRDIVRSYEDDMVKYAAREDKTRIKECFQSIPRQLSKENKKFQYSVVKKGSRASQYAGSLQWIEDAGIITRCYNLSATELPLEGYALAESFKVYMADCGLFASMLEGDVQADILTGNFARYKGAIFENLVADMFTKMGRKLYYYHQNSGLEVDFIMRYKGECVLVEVKANTGYAKSVRTILDTPTRYHVDSAIKLGNYNIGRGGKILTLPLYMAFLLRNY